MRKVSDEALARSRRGGLLMIAAMAALVPVSWHATGRSGDDDVREIVTAGIDTARISATTRPGAGNEATPWASIDRASVDWDKAHVEPDPPPFCFAAYGD